MPVTFDKLLGEPMYHKNRIAERGGLPMTGAEGQLLIDTATNQLYVWYKGEWQLVCQLAP